MAINIELLERLPKVELHCHLDGCLRIETILDLAQKDKVKLPSHDIGELSKTLPIGNNRVTLEEYLESKSFIIAFSEWSISRFCMGK